MIFGKEIAKMNLDILKKQWLEEESIAHVHGWDFSHINERYVEEENLPWDYKEVINSYLETSDHILDIDTGGGEFLLSLGHPYKNTSATEGYPPNVKLCKEILLPLGIDFKEMNDVGKMPFQDECFDIVINRHGDYDVSELNRVLKPNGLFITQQVGSENDRELVELLLPNTQKPFPNATLEKQVELFKAHRFEIVQAEECYPSICFYDVGALVWFARIIEWEFPGFSVESCFPQLVRAQEIIEKTGKLEGTTHRYLIVARKR